VCIVLCSNISLDALRPYARWGSNFSVKWQRISECTFLNKNRNPVQRFFSQFVAVCLDQPLLSYLVHFHSDSNCYCCYVIVSTLAFTKNHVTLRRYDNLSCALPRNYLTQSRMLRGGRYGYASGEVIRYGPGGELMKLIPEDKRVDPALDSAGAAIDAHPAKAQRPATLLQTICQQRV